MLSVADVPPPGTGFWPRVAEFALSFHAYEYFGCSHVDNTYERTTRGKCDASDQLAED